MNLGTLKETASQYLFEIIGYGFWWVWLLMALNTPMLSEDWLLQPSQSWLNLASVASGAAISFFLAFGTHGRPAYRVKLAITVVSAFFLFLNTIGVYLFGFMGISDNAILLIAAGSLMGAALSLLQIAWGTEFFGDLEPSKTCVVTVFSFVFALVVSIFLLDKGLLSVIIAAISPAASAALLVRRMKDEPPPLSTKGNPEQKESPHSSRGSQHKRLLPKSLMLLLFFFALSFGVFRSLLPSAHETGYQSFYTMALVCIVPMAIVLLVGFLRIRNLNLALTVSLGMITLGIFLLSLFESGNYAVESACMSSGVRCVDIVAWIMVSDVAREKSDSSLQVYGLGRGLGCLGALAGFIVGYPLSLHQNLALSASLLMLLILLAVCAFRNIESGNNSLSAETADAPSTDSSDSRGHKEPEPLTRDETVSLLADEYHLSPREREVAELLVAGRSVGNIAQRLVIANSTVASHVRNIYRKLEVHNRQELLDMIEDREKQPERR